MYAIRKNDIMIPWVIILILQSEYQEIIPSGMYADFQVISQLERTIMPYYYNIIIYSQVKSGGDMELYN